MELAHKSVERGFQKGLGPFASRKDVPLGRCVIGYNSSKIRGYLRRRGVRIVIPHQSHQRLREPFDKQRYRQRNRVERLINSLKRFRRVATRYVNLSDNYLAMVSIAAITIWLRALVES